MNTHLMILSLEDLQSGMASRENFTSWFYFVDAYAMFFTLPGNAASTGSGLFA